MKTCCCESTPGLETTTDWLLQHTVYMDMPWMYHNQEPCLNVWYMYM